MNLAHRAICGSGRWKRHVESDVVPWALDGVHLGWSVLEIGPGPGVTTDCLSTRVGYLTCVEIDPRLAADLSGRTAGRNVTVLCEDASAMSLPTAAFDGAVCLTMLHHVPSADLQDRLFREVARVVRPGGVFVGVDSTDSVPLRALHLFDTFTPVDPCTLARRLERAGFARAQIDRRRGVFRFQARR